MKNDYTNRKNEAEYWLKNHCTQQKHFQKNNCTVVQGGGMHLIRREKRIVVSNLYLIGQKNSTKSKRGEKKWIKRSA